ncbi:hypothetical protein GN958_ATG07690 [Phytophthora infestans]|uniref:Uncharacterized protein n=1 Tax=Phytophthora infestans TaxID=4787 RepID=A0A8S9UQP1_PHYIN|nr:hypothetical protein GN958_ATG07690 [Phytophthora infestans]
MAVLISGPTELPMTVNVIEFRGILGLPNHNLLASDVSLNAFVPPPEPDEDVLDASTFVPPPEPDEDVLDAEHVSD